MIQSFVKLSASRPFTLSHGKVLKQLLVTSAIVFISSLSFFILPGITLHIESNVFSLSRSSRTNKAL